jgi:hypothetical protein
MEQSPWTADSHWTIHITQRFTTRANKWYGPLVDWIHLTQKGEKLWALSNRNNEYSRSKKCDKNLWISKATVTLYRRTVFCWVGLYRLTKAIQMQQMCKDVFEIWVNGSRNNGMCCNERMLQRTNIQRNKCYNERCYNERFYNERVLQRTNIQRNECYNERCDNERFYNEWMLQRKIMLLTTLQWKHATTKEWYKEQCYNEQLYSERCYNEPFYNERCYKWLCYNVGFYNELSYNERIFKGTNATTNDATTNSFYK